MKWFTDLFVEQSFVQAIVVLSLICAVGLLLSKIKIKGVSLGITFVFFAGILAGHLGLNINPQMLCAWPAGRSQLLPVSEEGRNKAEPAVSRRAGDRHSDGSRGESRD